MERLLIFLGMTIGSALGWWLGDKVGIMTAIFVSTFGGAVGVYLGWRIHSDYLS